MSVFGALLDIRAESRFVDPVTGTTWVDLGAGSSFKSRAGQKVTQESARSLAVYFACLNVVASDCAKIPRKAFKARSDRGRDVAIEHHVHALVHTQPNPESLPITFYGALILNSASWGDGYAEIERDGATRPLALWPIPTPRVTPKRRANLDLYYEVRNPDGTKVDIEAENMLHVPGLGSNGLTGWSVLKHASESLGLGLATQAYGADFFGNGASPSGALKFPGKLSQKAQDRLRASWGERYGGVNRHKPAYLEEGMEWVPISVPPDDAQFLETRRFTVEEICRWFRVSPAKVQHAEKAKGWNTRELQQAEHVEDCLMPWLERLEQELTRKLFTEEERASGYYVKHVVQALMRGDQKTRATYYRMRQMTGTLSPNDIRELEDENPIPPEKGGDVYVMMSNMARLEDIAEGKTVGGNQPATEGSDGGEDNEKRTDREGAEEDTDKDGEKSTSDVARAMLPVFEDAARRMLRKEGKALTRLAQKHAGEADPFRSSVHAFLEKHGSQLVEALRPGLDACGVQDPAPTVRVAASLWCAESANEYVAAFERGEVRELAASRERDLPARWALAVAWIGDNHAA